MKTNVSLMVGGPAHGRALYLQPGRPVDIPFPGVQIADEDPVPPVALRYSEVGRYQTVNPARVPIDTVRIFFEEDAPMRPADGQIMLREFMVTENLLIFSRFNVRIDILFQNVEELLFNLGHQFDDELRLGLAELWSKQNEGRPSLA